MVGSCIVFTSADALTSQSIFLTQEISRTRESAMISASFIVEYLVKKKGRTNE